MKCKYMLEGVEYHGPKDFKGTKFQNCITNRKNIRINFFYKILVCRNCKLNGGKTYYEGM